MIEKFLAGLRKSTDQVEFLIYVLAAGAIAIGMSMLDTPWWCYFPPVILLGYASVARYLTARQTPGKHRKRRGLSLF